MMRRRIADLLIASGSRAERKGLLPAACRRYRAAAALAPRYAASHLNLGAVLESMEEFAGALRAYERAHRAEPANPYAQYNLGRLRYTQGHRAGAEQLLQAALLGKPDFPEALTVLAGLEEARGDLGAAAASLERALALDGRVAGAWYNYGEVLFKLEQYDAAEAALRRTIELEPRFSPAWHLLGKLLRAEARVEEAVAAFAAAQRIEPDNFGLESLQLHALNLSDKVSAAELFERHRAFGARLEAAVAPRFKDYAGAKDPQRRLRIGYVSSDFNWHPVAVFTIPLFERHDRAVCEVVGYYTGGKSDETTARIRASADAWRDAASLSDEGLADLIHRDAINVLVDLTGHSGVYRLGVFARQPAPVQVSWLGYLNTSGLTRIQYRLSDARADPPGASDRMHTEQLVRLPHSLWCFRPAHRTSHASEPPCLRNGFVTFGSFNSMTKLSGIVRGLWAQLLARLPRSRLLLVDVPEGRARADLLRDFAAAGVAGERLTVLPRLGLVEYLQQFDAVDIALDTTPYGGGTTTFDALWMGVPVLTLAGERPVSRSAASILGALGLEEWIAASADEYVRLALAHATDPGRIAALRGSLRQRLQASPLMDEAGFARDIEAAYRGMWRAWCGQRIT
jgi:predicted O-linked N-acetylglucosamine transferase (SPINDLY family)